MMRRVLPDVLVRLVLAAGCALSLLNGCNGTYDAEAGEHCRQAGYSIAARSEACTQDRDAANQLYERFDETYSCVGSTKATASYDCAVALNAATCDQVQEWGSDLERWLSDTPSCHAVIGGRSLPSASAEACGPLAEALAGKMAGCGQPDQDLVALTASVQLSLAQTGCIEPTAAALAACQAQLTGAACFADGVDEPSSWLSLAPDCAALQGASL